MISTEMYKTRIEAPKKEPRGIYAPYIDQFMASENMSMKFNCSNTKEAELCKQSIQLRARKSNMNITVWKKNCAVYVIKG